MFPPETTQTTFCRPALLERRGERQRAGALRDHARALGQQPDGRGRLVERDRERAVEHGLRRAATSPASTSGEPEPSTKRRPYSTGRGSPAASGAVSGAPVSGSTAYTSRRRPQRLDRARDPDAQPAAAERDDHGVDVGQVLEDLEADRAVAGHHALVRRPGG